MSDPAIFYKKGDVVCAPFPYQQDFEQEKLRPVLLLAPSDSGGFVCAYITSKSHRQNLIKIQVKDFKEGYIDSFNPSYVRPDIIYTAATSTIQKKYGTLKDEKVDEIVQSLVNLLLSPPTVAPVAPAFQRPPRPSKLF
ncbi:type II toxin-antitoxin system PemK/MazF family toxin [Leptolyngbya sp. DQ-M1]|uniref:type II toxin-antitoxin system PemK/MazF family toxin n=1 Tax=Leptolyngbya sp. DQ-M1 TaxID=2933920 RepID=UPI003299A3D5